MMCPNPHIVNAFIYVYLVYVLFCCTNKYSVSIVRCNDSEATLPFDSDFVRFSCIRNPSMENQADFNSRTKTYSLLTFMFTVFNKQYFRYDSGKSLALCT